MIDRFLRSRRRPIFFYVRRDIADLVAEIGGSRFLTSGMGIDKVLDLDDWPEKPHSKVQGALKKAARARFKLVEIRPSLLSREERARIDSITQSYLQRSAVQVEMHFINRPLSFDDDAGARMFVLQEGPDAKVFGYVVLDPYFDHGQVQGYLLNLIRFESTRLWGVYYTVVATLVSRLRQEGIAQLSLGFCPLLHVDPTGCSPLLSRQVQWMERKLADIEYLTRLRAMKEVFPGRTPQRYFVTRSPWALTTLLAFLRATRVPLLGIVRKTLADE
jgi:lysylphosphatidylglycerol synthetase-like protein (DUF2156 family)